MAARPLRCLAMAIKEDVGELADYDGAKHLRAKWAVDVATTSNASSALDDLCLLSQASVVVQASIQSQFAALAAILGRGVLVVLNGTSAKAVDESCRGWIEAGVLDVVVAPLMREAEGPARV